MTITFYRTHTRLELPDETRLEPGKVFTSQQLSQDKLDRLMELEVISPAMPPPLAAIPGWRSRAARLSKEGVDGFGQFFEQDNEKIAEWFKTKPETIQQWKLDLLLILEFRR